MNNYISSKNLIAPFKKGVLFNLRSRMFMAFGALFIIILVMLKCIEIKGIPFTNFGGEYLQQQSEVFRNLNLVADLKKERLLQWIEERRDDTKVLAESSIIQFYIKSILTEIEKNVRRGRRRDDLWNEVRNAKTYQTLMQHLNLVKGRRGVYQSIQFVDAETGTIIASTQNADLGVNISSTNHFKRALNSSDTFVDIEKIPQSTTDLIITSLIKSENPHNESKNKVLAVLIMHINPDDMLKPMERLDKISEAFLINRDLKIITLLKHPLADGRIAKPLEYHITSKPAILAVRGEQGLIATNDYRGEPVLAAYRHIPIASEVGWGMVVKLDKAEGFAPLRRSIVYSALFILMSIFMILVLTFIMANNFSRPIQILSRTLQKVEAGDLNARAQISAANDVGILAGTLNTMLQRFQIWRETLEKQVQVRTAKLSSTNDELTKEIIQHKEVEETLRESEERYRTLVSNIDSAFFRCDENWTIHFISDGIQEISGYPASDFIRDKVRSYPSIIHPEDIKMVTEIASDCLSKKIPVEVEYRVVCADGKIRWVRKKSQGIVNRNGKLAWIDGVVFDITDRKLAEEALKVSEEKYRKLVDNSLVGVYKTNINGDILYVNEALSRMFEFESPTEMISVGALARYKNKKDTKGLVESLKKTGKIDNFEMEVVTKRRKTKNILTSATIDGEIISGMVIDITERKRAEKECGRLIRELVDKNKELEHIVYAASHDLRSPLVNILGFSKELEYASKQVHSVLQNGEVSSQLKEKLAPILEEDIPEALQYIFKNTSKMDSLLSGLLQFSRTGRTALTIKQLDMNKLLSDIFEAFDYQIKKAGANVTKVKLSLCRGDMTQINQIFSNLLDNALKYLDPNRPGIIKISGHKAKSQIVYCVEDNGIGIAKEHQGKIFEMFYQLNPGTSSGEGLGLTIARKILDRHKGKIWVESERHKGSKFFVSIPAK